MKTSYTLAELAQKIGATLHIEFETSATCICSLDQPMQSAITFCRKLSLSKSEHTAFTKAAIAALIVNPSFVKESATGLNLLIVEDPFASLFKLIPYFYKELSPTPGINPKADIHPTAKIGSNVHIGAFCSIGEFVVIEDSAVIHPHVVVYPHSHIGARTVVHSSAIIREGCKIGADCTIHCGVVIGADGFGYVPDPKLGLRKVPQVGTVTLEDNIEIGANSCVDRATLGFTSIGKGTKIDNLVQIGHNVIIGRNSILCALSGIAGSAKIGNGVTMGAQSGAGNNVNIGDGVRGGARSGFTNNVLDKGDYLGFPAQSATDWRRQQIALKKLPKVLKELNKKSLPSENESDG